MANVTVDRENSAQIDIYYEDHGSGQAVVLIHGYPLDGRSWEKQEHALLRAGFRVITYDRRGFGQSARPSGGYDYDTFAADLDGLLNHLQLESTILVGHAMGTGEITRYLSTYGSARVSKAVLLSAIPPFLLKTGDNPDGVDKSVFDRIKAAVLHDRPAFIRRYLDDFFGVGLEAGRRAGEQARLSSFRAGVSASPIATYACVDTWLTDFRADLPWIDVPVLLVHGDADRLLPFHATAARLPGLIKDLELVTIRDGPHSIAWSYPEEVNAALLSFLTR
ncbi:alpha/beta fold hydrolase [Myceligenerans indicum]|uniref:Alpha/beta hydrolase n=1 Tax=Myceligenerans indicum TaxID=2593663 RepID=A0ABS1LGD0_9MICO|nr:alpha/beta hydrolase [Myceligenerans indicum]MBL0885282.1 alpha/beta hydrolase [Myceligenerans indicum]